MRILGGPGGAPPQPWPAERRLGLFFAIVYFAQGTSGGLSKQPFIYYFKSLGMGADAVAALFALAAVPWMLKPLYGLLTDLVPLWGYRRKSYLMLMGTLAACGYASLGEFLSPEMIAWLLLAGTLGIAAVDVVADALMVEEGLRLGRIAQFQSHQWTWLNMAAVTAALTGGWLSHGLAPDAAFRAAAFLMAAAPATVIVATWCLVRERRTAMDRTAARRTVRELGQVLRSKPFWTVGSLLICWSLIPNFSTPLYYHAVDRLDFDQYFIGQLACIGSLGAAAGAYTYRKLLVDRFTTPSLLTLSIVLSAGMALGYLFLEGGRSAVLLYFLAGVVSITALLTLFGLAARVCHPQAAGFTFAALMALYSAAAQCSAVFSGHLYERVFDRHLTPLIYLAALCTLAVLAWVPLFRTEVDVPRRMERAEAAG